MTQFTECQTTAGARLMTRQLPWVCCLKWEFWLSEDFGDLPNNKSVIQDALKDTFNVPLQQHPWEVSICTAEHNCKEV